MRPFDSASRKLVRLWTAFGVLESPTETVIAEAARKARADLRQPLIDQVMAVVHADDSAAESSHK
jgi:hypothetical protein